MVKGFQGVIIWTEDLKSLLPFYRDTLGLGTQMEADGFAVTQGVSSPSDNTAKSQASRANPIE